MAEFAEFDPGPIRNIEPKYPGDDSYTVQGSTSSYTTSFTTMNHSSIVLLHYTHNQLNALRVSTLLLSILGLIGNLLVVLVILSRRRWRFANSMFVLNIAIANLFICAFTLPLMTRALFDINWEPAPQFCQLSGFLDNTAFACSSWSLALGSVERFFLVVFPMKHRELMKYNRAVTLSFLIWGLSVFLSVLPILGWNTYIYSPVTFTCGIDTNLRGFHHYYFFTYLTVVLPGPLMISTVSYTYILFYLRSDLWKSQRRRTKNVKVVLPMILISVAFLLCFLPTVIVGFDITVNPGIENGQPKLKMIEYFVIHLLLLGNSAMNPLIFTMCSTKFRSSARFVLELLFERVILILFYILYVIYYTLVTICKAIGNLASRACARAATCEPACLRSVGKYDSLNDVVIKITLTNSDEALAGDRCDEHFPCCCGPEDHVRHRGGSIDAWGQINQRGHASQRGQMNNREKNNDFEIAKLQSRTTNPDNPTSETVI